MLTGEKARIAFCGANLLSCSMFNCSAITSYFRKVEKPEKTREFEGSVFKALNKNHFHSGKKIPFKIGQGQGGVNGVTTFWAKRIRLTVAGDKQTSEELFCRVALVLYRGRPRE